ncbi:MAG: TetR/AcrR family transcriptional regulator [Pseudomonadota bacterium]
MATKTSSPALSRRERKKSETRARILSAAFELMTERGYDNVKIGEIAERADVANATFFLHFPTKAALVSAFNEQVAEKIVERLGEFDLGAVEQLELLRAILLDEWSRHADLLRQIVIDAAAQDQKAFSDTSASLIALVEDIVRKGQAAGDFSKAFDADIVAQSLLASWRAATLNWAIHGDAERARAANRQTLDLILQGVSPRK